MSGNKVSAESILDRFRLDENGAFIYARDIHSSGAIRKREGEKVRIRIARKVKGLHFRENGKRFWVSAGAAAFVVAYGSLPVHPGVVIIKPSDRMPDDYREENLTYTLMSDTKHKGSMRVRSCKNGFQSQIYVNGVRIVRFFRSKNDAERFASRLHRFSARKVLREFWSGIQRN